MLGNRTGYGGVGLVPSYTGLVGRGRVGASPAPSTNTSFAQLQVLVRLMRKVERRIQFGHPSWVRGPRLV